MNKLIMVLCILVAILTGFGLGSYNSIQKKYKMNLKCIQGELYEEIRPKFYVKSHLDCFEERSF
jgi:hypothetical protein